LEIRKSRDGRATPGKGTRSFGFERYGRAALRMTLIGFNSFEIFDAVDRVQRVTWS